MSAPMWRMNGLWMAAVLVLCALLLSSEVRCQDDTDAADAPATDAPAADPPADATDAADAADPSAATDSGSAPAAPDATIVPDAGADPSAASDEQSATSAHPGVFPATIIHLPINPDNQDDITSGTSGTTAAPSAGEMGPAADVQVVKIVPNVNCVGSSDVSESNAVRVEVATDDCEATKNIIEENPAAWCNTAECDLNIFQDEKTLLIASEHADLRTLAAVLQSEDIKEKLGVTKAVTPSSSSGSSVLVGILVSGLLAALGITIGYFKCQRRAETKGVRLAEEAYPVDQENQGNTLVSVAPLNPPPETPEKPSVNGESPEEAKTPAPPPPTNGHPTANTADTEM